MGIILGIYFTEALSVGNFSIKFRITDQRQQKDPELMVKTKTSKYKYDYSCRGSNKNFNLITCEGKNSFQ